MARAQAADQGTPASASEGDATRLEEIVVSASKRADETLKEAPGGMTALTGKTLDNLGVVDFQDYLPYVPGLSAAAAQTGTPGSYNVILRGLNTGSSQSTATVGYYLDDTPLTPSSSNSTAGTHAPDPALGDIERIEVLKGPQATLYGASTLGGIIKIVSKKPELTTFSADASVSGVTVDDGGSGYSARGAVNIPLIQNTLAARLSAYDREDPGFTDNVFTGQNNVNLDHAYGGQLSLRYKPTQQLTFDLTGLIQHLYSPGNTQEWLDPQTLRPIYGYDKDFQFFNDTTATQLSLVDLSANYDTAWGTLTNSLGYAFYYSSNVGYTLTPEFAPIFRRFRLTSPPTGVATPTFQNSHKLTDELRFTSIRMNHFLWQAGLFYTHEKVGKTNIGEAFNYPNPVPL
ncbi:MAG: TonB-dependent receptor, partial [Steroidobacteraceae bacterium]